MVRVRSVLRSPWRVRPLATGFVLAAAGTAWAAPSAVETLDAAAMRELEAARGDAAIRQTAAEDASGVPRPLPESKATALPLVPADSKTASGQAGVVKRLGETSRRGDHETTPRIQQVSSPPGGITPPPAPASKKSRNPIVSFFSRKPSTDATRRPSPAARSTKPSSTSTVSRGGFFGRMLRPFRDEEKETATGPEQPPVPPPLPVFSQPMKTAKQPPTAPLPQDSYAPVSRPAVSPTDIAGSATPPPAALPEVVEDNPFADVQTEPAMVVDPAPAHPLDDAFANIRGTEAPAIAEVTEIDPEFTNPVQIRDPGAPRPLDPDAVSSTEEFAPVRTAEPRPAPRQSAATRLAELQRKLAERSGLGGFQGFCPVALRDRRELVDARPEFLSVYQNRTYELSSAEAKARFEANPARYAPMNGGNDAVLTSRGAAEAEGNLAHAVWFKDKLYLFRTAETMREFNAEPNKFAVAE